MVGARPLATLALAVGAGILGALAACDSFSGEDGPSAPLDAGGAPTDAGPVEAAPADAAGPVADGGVDAATPFACPADYLLCDLFERQAVQGLWSFRYGTEGLLALDDAVASSPTRSLRVTPNADKGGVLVLDVAKPAITGVEVTFSVRTDSAEGDFTQVVDVELNRGTSFAIVEIRDGQLTLVEQMTSPDGGVFYDWRPAAALTLGAFQRFRLRVDILQGTFSLALAEAAAGTPERTLIHKHSSVTSVFVGANFAGSRKAPHWIDDVVVRKL